MTAGNNYITLRWLNTLGGWDEWTFTARHSYGFDISNVQTFNIDIFQRWDSNFTNGSKEQDILSLDAQPTVILRSGFLNEQQINAVSQVKISKNIQTISGVGVVENQSIIIDRSSFTYRTDKEKLIEFEFKITLPKVQIQTS